MSLEVLKIIVMLCNINSLEDRKSRWTELQVVEKYQRDCRV